jgi:hypothetical protein
MGAQEKTFFFADYEGAGRVRGLTWMVPTVTAKERAGDFSNGPEALPGTPDDNPVIADPRGGTFPNSRIPPDRLHALAKVYLPFFPLPDGPGRLTHIAGDDRTKADQSTVRIDHHLGSKDSLSGTYFFGQETEDQFKPQLPVGVDRIQFRTQNLILTPTPTFISQLVNQLAVGYVRLRNDAFNLNPAATVTLAAAGFQFSLTDRRFNGLPTLLLSGPERLPNFKGVSGAGRTNSTYPVKDDVSWV